jgi:hypothetical protein
MQALHRGVGVTRHQVLPDERVRNAVVVRQFFSLVELNIAIAALLTDLNRRPFKKLPGCRAEAFDAIDRPAMKPLPATRYEYAEWTKAKVNIDYHVDVERQSSVIFPGIRT